MGCLTATERVQYPLLSLSNPGRYVRDIEVDTDAEETPASTPPAQQSAGRETFAARVPRKRRWKGEPEKGQHRDSAVLKRKRPLEELCSRRKQKAPRLVLPASSVETRRATGAKETPSSEEDGNTRTAEGAAAAATVAADDAATTKPHSRESLEKSVATEILNSEDDEGGEMETETGSGSGSSEEEKQSLAGTPTAALYEQVVPLLRYLDRKVAKYADPRQPGSYVEGVHVRPRGGGDCGVAAAGTAQSS
ncbi:hypothetical protein AXG93_2204s1000 [Marchantia polymorpha subsp. ruderalis]|uniref:Uncharacterized protein n=1 Tax=Marchantia polymorpha subsp. ruderalis TaxID=1480154 RepID=A0A176WRM0_MARPO|nr:hypothetical protein AXG93_2204s1000 [Marchantia polymorpha subsp. ruderalis]